MKQNSTYLTVNAKQSNEIAKHSIGNNREFGRYKMRNWKFFFSSENNKAVSNFKGGKWIDGERND